MLRYSMNTNTLPILIKKGSNKTEPIYLVFSKQWPDHYCLNTTGGFSLENAKPLLDTTGDLAFTKDKESSQFATAIQKQLLLQGDYHYLVLVRLGFISEKVETILAESIISQEFHNREIKLPETLDCRALMRQLSVQRKDTDSGMKTVNFSEVAITGYLTSEDETEDEGETVTIDV